jgi:hypothetical protein
MLNPIETIDQLFLVNDVKIWELYIPVFVDLYKRSESLTDLGVYLTRDHIPALMSEMVSVSAARSWVDLWRSFAPSPEFDIPFSLLDAAVQYKQSPDRRILLALPPELRFLLESSIA